MVFCEAGTLLDRFDDARRLVTGMFPTRRRTGDTYTGFTRRLLTLGSRLLEPIVANNRQHIQRIAGHHWQWKGFVPMSIDGSRVNAPRTHANEQTLGCTRQGKAGPQMWLTALMHLNTGLPWAWRIGRANASERTHLREMLGVLPTNALLVADAGFVGYDLMRQILANDASFLIRAGANVRLIQELGYAEHDADDTVYLWPKQRMLDMQPPLALRLIRVRDGKKTMCLLTNLDAKRLSEKHARQLYDKRWGVEVLFRSLKQTLGRRTMRSCAPEQAKAELAWTMVGLQLLGMLSVEQIIKTGRDPIRWSAAESLRAVRQVIKRGQPNHHRSLFRALAVAMIDSYVRKRCKKARDWPHQKTRRPPGQPHCRKATEWETLRAKELRMQNSES